jgi:hypothetical protein
MYNIKGSGTKGAPEFSINICMSNKTERASVFRDDHELLLSK